MIAGFGLGLSLIVAIGAQNLFVLRQGIRRERVFAVAAVCALSDAALIALGVSGLGAVLTAVPWLVDVVRWAGALFLSVYGLRAAYRAWRPSGQALDSATPSAQDLAAGGQTDIPPVQTRTRLLRVLLTCLALTWLNPHVYLDTVFLLGSIASTHGHLRWAFAGGAMAASIVWFFALGYGARLLGRILATPLAWRVLDGLIAVVMLWIALTLAFGG